MSKSIINRYELTREKRMTREKMIQMAELKDRLVCIFQNEIKDECWKKKVEQEKEKVEMDGKGRQVVGYWSG